MFFSVPDALEAIIESSTGPEILAIGSTAIFLSAAVLLFWKPSLGYGLGLAGGLAFLPWLIFSEIESGQSSWISFNYTGTSPEVEAILGLVKLKILSTTLVVIAIACSSLRLLPTHWVIGKSAVCSQTWPAFATGLLFVAVWFVHSVTPWRVPGSGFGGATAGLRILHVEKRGLHFRETELSVLRNGATFISRANRRLFRYRFESHVTRVSLGESPAILARALALMKSQNLRELRTPAAKALRSWNGEGWYIVLRDSRPLAFTSENQTSPPPEVTSVFYSIENLSGREISSPSRDICFGFCYDPVAMLSLEAGK